MPLTYSIAYGLIGGLMVWTSFQGVFLLLALVGIKVPGSDDDDEAEAKEDAAPEKAVEEADA